MSDEHISEDDQSVKKLVVPDFDATPTIPNDVQKRIMASDLSENDKLVLTVITKVTRQLDFVITTLVTSNEDMRWLEREHLKIVRWKNLVWNKVSVALVMIGIIFHTYLETVITNFISGAVPHAHAADISVIGPKTAKAP